MGTYIAHYHDEHDCYAEINLNEKNQGWWKAEPVEMVYIKENPKDNFQIMKLFPLTR